MPGLWKRLEEAFEACHAMEGAERAAYLAQLEQSDPDLYIELCSLLESDEQAAADSFFEGPVVNRIDPVDDPRAMIGQVLGPYHLRRVIGEGGMGFVFEAEQVAPIRQRVALKVIRSSIAGERTRKRFDLEIQTLARLNHEHIAQVFLSGMTDNGLAYFAMEFVEGVPLGDYCLENRIPIEERLRLFAQICRAVHYAHQRGIIHRDLKPANILIKKVDGLIEPKIIDFGIAKAVQPEEGGDLSFLIVSQQLTLPGMAVGTLSYMSPEQTLIDQEGIDLRTDVYSLGVLLYEMLVGVLPLDETQLHGDAWDHAFKAIRETKPKMPSRAVLRSGSAVAETLAVSREVLAKRYRGELDWIVMKALEKEAGRRYGSAKALADDLERYLQKRPVAAGPPSLFYQLKRFIQRNLLLSIGVAILVLGICAGVFGLVSGLVRAQRAEIRIREEAETAQKTIELLEEFVVSASPVNFGRDVKVLDQLQAFGPRIEAAEWRPEVRASLNHIISKAFRAVGAHDEALVHMERAASLRRRLLGLGHEETLLSQAELAFLKSELEQAPQQIRRFRLLTQDLLRYVKGDHALVIESRLYLLRAYVAVGDQRHADLVAAQIAARLGPDGPTYKEGLYFALSLAHEQALGAFGQGRYQDCLRRLEAVAPADEAEPAARARFQWLQNRVLAARARFYLGEQELARRQLAAAIDQAERWYGEEHTYPAQLKVTRFELENLNRAQRLDLVSQVMAPLLEFFPAPSPLFDPVLEGLCQQPFNEDSQMVAAAVMEAFFRRYHRKISQPGLFIDWLACYAMVENQRDPIAGEALADLVVDHLPAANAAQRARIMPPSRVLSLRDPWRCLAESGSAER